MNVDLENAQKEFIKYTEKFNLKDKNVKGKQLHSLRVMKISSQIAINLKLNKEQIQIATLIGLLHDIGRFKQYTEIGLGDNLEGFDHGDYGAKVLFEDNMIRKFIEKSKYDEIIKKAIINHNKFSIEKGLTEEEQIFAKIIRDADKIDILYGQDYFYEEILGLKFKISPFSFFQTNTLGAEVLYKTARDFVGETKDKVIFDLYSGTGTIAQMLAPVAKKVVGVEIVEEAVEAAKVNAELNGLDNCEFIAGDVLKVVDELEDKPDFIVLDPPRDGIHPKAIQKIIDFGVEQMVYISCKPTSLARDLEVFEAAGYKVKRATAVDQFPNTVHIESMVLLQKDNI